jgi:uncharacterized protein YyaL (SSP411 family)
LHRAALRHPAPGAAIVVGDPADSGTASVPLLRERPLLGGGPAAYVCRHFTCDRPTSDIEELARQMSSR